MAIETTRKGLAQYREIDSRRLDGVSGRKQRLGGVGLKRSVLFLASLLLVAPVVADTFLVPTSASWSLDGTPAAQDMTVAADGTIGVMASGGVARVGTVDGGWFSNTFSGVSGERACIQSIGGDNWLVVYDDGAGNIKYANSTNDGVSWNSAQTLAGASGLLSSSCSIGYFESTGTVTIQLVNDDQADRAEFWRSTDGGSSFSQVQTETAATFGTPGLQNGVSQSFNGYVIFARGDGASVWRTTDDGASWNQINIATSCGGDTKGLGAGPATGSAYDFVGMWTCNSGSFIRFYFITGNTVSAQTVSGLTGNVFSGRYIGYDAESDSYVATVNENSASIDYYYSTDDGATWGSETVASSANDVGGAWFNNGTHHLFSANGVYTASGGLIEGPSAPAGLSGFVQTADSDGAGPNEATIVLRWPVSANDPDQDVGDYYYWVTLDGSNQAENDTVTAADANGVREFTFSNTNVAGTHSYSIQAQNATTGEFSANSCTITLDHSTAFSQSSCGDSPPLAGIGGGGVIPGVDVDQVADDLGIDRSAFGWIIGASITFGIAAAAYGGTRSAILAGAGALFGVGISTAFGLFPLWLILILVLFGAAAVFLVRR